MLFFRNSDYDVSKEVIEHLEHQTGELRKVSEYVDVRVWQGSIEVRARWRGHEAWEDTWESVKAMREDVPVLLQNYLDATRSSETAKQKVDSHPASPLTHIKASFIPFAARLGGNVVFCW
jgi:hypothetical protein